MTEDEAGASVYRASRGTSREHAFNDLAYQDMSGTVVTKDDPVILYIREKLAPCIFYFVIAMS